MVAEKSSTGGGGDARQERESPSNNKQNYVVLNDLLREACTDLMQDYGLQGQLQACTQLTDSDGDTAVAAIDFSGRDLRGTIGLRMSNTVVEETYRAATKGAQPTAPEQDDWTCELANQLMGRLKNKLREYNVSFTVNSPRMISTATAEELSGAMRNRFLCDSGSLAGYLDVMIASGVTLVHNPPQTPLPDEGELVLF